MSRGDGLARQLQLMQLLERRQEIVVPQVAEELGYTVRTLYRDLQVLERVGVPIYQERRGQKARWRVMEGYRRRLSITLSWPELLATLLGRKLLETLPLREAAQSALGKLSEALPAEVSSRAAVLEPLLSAHPGGAQDCSARGEALRTLLECVERGEAVRFSYRKPGAAAAERLVDPYLVHVQGGAVYLIGLCHDRNALRTFLLDRISAASRTGAVFGARAPFQTGALLHGIFGPWEGPLKRVRLRFGAQAAERVAGQRIHPTQTLQTRSDGALDLELRAPLCPALSSWLLGFGADVRVLAPAPLRERLARAHRRALEPG